MNPQSPIDKSSKLFPQASPIRHDPPSPKASSSSDLRFSGMAGLASIPATLHGSVPSDSSLRAYNHAQSIAALGAALLPQGVTGNEATASTSMRTSTTQAADSQKAEVEEEAEFESDSKNSAKKRKSEHTHDDAAPSIPNEARFIRIRPKIQIPQHVKISRESGVQSDAAKAPTSATEFIKQFNALLRQASSHSRATNKVAALRQLLNVGEPYLNEQVLTELSKSILKHALGPLLVNLLELLHQTGQSHLTAATINHQFGAIVSAYPQLSHAQISQAICNLYEAAHGKLTASIIAQQGSAIRALDRRHHTNDMQRALYTFGREHFTPTLMRHEAAAIRASLPAIDDDTEESEMNSDRPLLTLYRNGKDHIDATFAKHENAAIRALDGTAQQGWIPGLCFDFLAYQVENRLLTPEFVTHQHSEMSAATSGRDWTDLKHDLDAKCSDPFTTEDILAEFDQWASPQEQNPELRFRLIHLKNLLNKQLISALSQDEISQLKTRIRALPQEFFGTAAIKELLARFPATKTAGSSS